MKMKETLFTVKKHETICLFQLKKQCVVDNNSNFNNINSLVHHSLAVIQA